MIAAVGMPPTMTPPGGRMGKKKKSSLYVDIDEAIKIRLDVLTSATRRKLNAEVQIAIEKHLAAEEPKYGLPLKPEEPTEQHAPPESPPAKPAKPTKKKNGGAS